MKTIDWEFDPDECLMDLPDDEPIEMLLIDLEIEHERTTGMQRPAQEWPGQGRR